MHMIDILILLSGLAFLSLGLAYIFQPRRVGKAISQMFKKARKKLERMERRLSRSSRSYKRTGWSFAGLGFILVFTYLQPIWIYNAIVLFRMSMGVFFPHMFQQVTTVQTTPVLCI
jgi:hypothetical protein